MDLKKILGKIAPDLNIDELLSESAQVPKMLAALIEQSNNQGKALEFIIKKLDKIEKKIDKAQETLALWDTLIQEDKKRQDT
jgi:uncharacterized protein YecA (UPF0149 family)